MPTPSVSIKTSDGLRHLIDRSERDLAADAEAILRDLGDKVRSARFWVHGGDADLRRGWRAISAI